MLYTEWSRVRYIGSMATTKGGEHAKILEHVSTAPGQELYRIKYQVAGTYKDQELIVSEEELAPIEEYVYRWVSKLGESHRNYSTPGAALGQANQWKGKRQRARVVWEDC